MTIDKSDPRLAKVAYAKIIGDGIEVYVRKLEIMIGRNSKSTTLDVILGENMNISRQHAKIVWNPSSRGFELIVMGKNGAHVNGTLYTPASPPQALQSQDIVTIADKSFYFLLPRHLGTKRIAPAHSKNEAPEDMKRLKRTSDSNTGSVHATDGEAHARTPVQINHPVPEIPSQSPAHASHSPQAMVSTMQLSGIILV